MTFKSFDTDGDGKLSFEEMKAGYGRHWDVALTDE